MKYIYASIFLLIFQNIFLIQGNAQDPKVFKSYFRDASFHFQTEQYDKAIEVYDKMLQMDSTNSNLHFLKGYSMLMGRFNREEAIGHMEKAVLSVSEKYREGVYHERNAPVLAYFLLGRAYHKNYEFENAINSYKKYQEYLDFVSFAEIEFVKRQIKSCDLAIGMIKFSTPVDFISVEGITGNLFPVTRPVLSGDNSMMIYSVDRPDGNSIAMITNEDDSWSNPRDLDLEINVSGYFYPASLSYDGKELFLVYRDLLVSDLYVSNFDGYYWSEPEPLGNKINTKYYETHASISADGSTLYFTSNRKGGWGGMDIYKTIRDPDGNWSDPENLGFGINTYYNEETPFISQNDSVLYFSSDGFETMGGYDVFVTRIDKDDFYTEPQNLGYPISTPDDDLFYNPGWDGTTSYFARQPENDLSNSIIYAVINSSQKNEIAELINSFDADESTVPFTIKGNVIGDTTYSNTILAELPSKDTTIIDNSLAEMTEVDTAIIDNSLAEVVEVDSIIIDNVENLLTEIETLEPDIVSPIENITVVDTKLTNQQLVNEYYYILNNILFGYDSYDLNENAIREVERIYMMMQKYREVKVDLIGHTDSEGPPDYNLKLSRLRAQSVANYLISKGVDRSRFKVLGRGEDEPVAINKYEDGSDARYGRRLNRNVSIRINNKPGDNVRMAEIFVPPSLVPIQDKVFTVLLLESDVFLDSIPNKVFGQDVSLISTDQSKMYVMGSFNLITDAHAYLNEVIDNGYPDASVMEKRKFESTIRQRTSGDQSENLEYTIQILALKNPIEISEISEIENVREFTGRDGLHRYIYGTYNSIDEAQKVLTRVKKIEGYETSFIRPIPANIEISAYSEIASSNIREINNLSEPVSEMEKTKPDLESDSIFYDPQLEADSLNITSELVVDNTLTSIIQLAEDTLQFTSEFDIDSVPKNIEQNFIAENDSINPEVDIITEELKFEIDSSSIASEITTDTIILSSKPITDSTIFRREAISDLERIFTNLASDSRANPTELKIDSSSISKIIASDSSSYSPEKLSDLETIFNKLASDSLNRNIAIVSDSLLSPSENTEDSISFENERDSNPSLALEIGESDSTLRPIEKVADIEDKGESRISDEIISAVEVPSDSLIYTIQLIATKRPIELSSFKDIENINVSSGKDGFFRYNYGSFASKEKANESLLEIRKIKDYESAFIKPIQLSNQQEESSRAEKNIAEDAVQKQIEEDLDNTLRYTIQIMAKKNPVVLSGLDDLDSIRVFIGDDGYYRYIYGDYKSADEARSELLKVKKIKEYESAFIRPLVYFKTLYEE